MSEVQARWEEFATKILELKQGSPKIVEVAEAYKRYLESLRPEARRYWMVTPTFAPGRMITTVVPRTLVPLYLQRYPEVVDRYSDLAEAYLNPPVPAVTTTISEKVLPRVKVLVCEPSFEPTTYYGSKIIERFISGPYRVKGFDVDSLWRIRDTRIPFTRKTVESSVVCGVGHGDRTIYTGQLLRTLWKINEYQPDEVMNKSIKLLSCYVGAELGPNLIEHGAKIFQGYQQEYVFYINPINYVAPWMDPIASELFLRTYCDGLARLLDGGTNRDAYEVEKSRLISNAEKMRVIDPEVASALYHDAQFLVMLGDPNAVIG